METPHHHHYHNTQQNTHKNEISSQHIFAPVRVQPTVIIFDARARKEITLFRLRALTHAPNQCPTETARERRKDKETGQPADTERHAPHAVRVGYTL